MIDKIKDNYLKIFTNCLLVKGSQRGLIFDAQRKQYHLIPISLLEFIKEIDGKHIDTFIAQFDNEDMEVAIEYLNFLLDKEFAFLCKKESELKNFPELNMEWDYPSIISNAVVRISNQKSIEEFNQFKGANFIPFIQFQIVEEIQNIGILKSYVMKMSEGYIKGIQIVFNNRYNIPKEDILELCNQSQIETLIAFNSSFEETIQSIVCNVVFIKDSNLDVLHCGKINASYFNIQIEHFTESIVYNTCLNRKLAIDADGNIKNCPSMAKSYGNIKDTKLFDVVNNPEFQKVWHIKKDEITKCKDCEFRHICTDCRAYTENPEDQFSAPLKCGYDPYTCEWEEWSTNPLKLKAIEYYGMQELVKK